MHEQQAIDTFLEGRPSAAEWAEWRRSLEARLTGLIRERELAPERNREALDLKIRQLRRQVRALAEEEAVTSFVEDSVRVTLAMGAGAGAEDDDPYHVEIP